MPADRPTILATSGGTRPGTRAPIELGPLISYALELSGVSGRRPRLCHIGTATGDQWYRQGWLDEAARLAGVDLVHLNLFPMPNVADPASYLGDADAVWVGGGSVANLLAVWRLHGVDTAMAQVWRAGVVLAGVSAGSLCWHVGGTTDSFGPVLRPIDNALAFLPYSNGVHYDSEPQRRPLLQSLIAEGRLPDGYATDDGVGLVYRDTELVEVVAEVRDKAAYRVRRDGDRAVEERLGARLLPGAD
jgi:peptidase E